MIAFLGLSPLRQVVHFRRPEAESPLYCMPRSEKGCKDGIGIFPVWNKFRNGRHRRLLAACRNLGLPPINRQPGPASFSEGAT